MFGSIRINKDKDTDKDKDKDNDKNNDKYKEHEQGPKRRCCCCYHYHCCWYLFLRCSLLVSTAYMCLNKLLHLQIRCIPERNDTNKASDSYATLFKFWINHYFKSICRNCTHVASQCRCSFFFLLSMMFMDNTHRNYNETIRQHV